MSLEENNSFVLVSLKEVSVEDEYYDVLQKVANHLQISLINSGGISVIREGFLDSFVGSYVIRETGAGLLIGLFKNVDGVLKPISFAIPGEIRLFQGSGTGELVPPAGWKISEDEEILSRYAIGTSPNYKVAPIVYIGI